MKAATLARYCNDWACGQGTYEEAREYALKKIEAYRAGKDILYQVHEAIASADTKFYQQWEQTHTTEFEAYDALFRDYENDEWIPRDYCNKIIYDAAFYECAPQAPIQAPEWPDF